jgi:hypothetical protein
LDQRAVSALATLVRQNGVPLRRLKCIVCGLTSDDCRVLCEAVALNPDVKHLVLCDDVTNEDVQRLAAAAAAVEDDAIHHDEANGATSAADQDTSAAIIDGADFDPGFEYNDEEKIVDKDFAAKAMTIHAHTLLQAVGPASCLVELNVGAYWTCEGIRFGQMRTNAMLESLCMSGAAEDPTSVVVDLLVDLLRTYNCTLRHVIVEFATVDEQDRINACLHRNGPVRTVRNYLEERNYHLLGCRSLWPVEMAQIADHPTPLYRSLRRGNALPVVSTKEARTALTELTRFLWTHIPTETPRKGFRQEHCISLSISSMLPSLRFFRSGVTRLAIKHDNADLCISQHHH